MLYTPSSPHVHNGNSISKVMLQVVYALIPGLVTYALLFGSAILVQLLLAITSGYLFEAVALKLRQKPLRPFLSDASVLVTACLLALSIPPIAPWWMIVLGMGFAILIGKHLYGGLGYNPFNPAMLAYAMLLISFPLEMTRWLAPTDLLAQPLTFAQNMTLIFAGDTASLDAVSSATILDHIKTQLGLEKTLPQITASNPIMGNFAGHDFELLALAFLAGGLWLLVRRIISWHIPVAMLGSLVLMASVFYFVDHDRFASPLFHLLAGATILGAFFIATDPVSASTTPRGKLIYGAGIGILIYVIRNWGAYPDAVAFAVLIMNMCAPMIDHYTRPKSAGAP